MHTHTDERRAPVVSASSESVQQASTLSSGELADRMRLLHDSKSLIDNLKAMKEFAAKGHFVPGGLDEYQREVGPAIHAVFVLVVLGSMLCKVAWPTVKLSQVFFFQFTPKFVRFAHWRPVWQICSAAWICPRPCIAALCIVWTCLPAQHARWRWSLRRAR